MLRRFWAAYNTFLGSRLLFWGVVAAAIVIPIAIHHWVLNGNDLESPYGAVLPRCEQIAFASQETEQGADQRRCKRDDYLVGLSIRSFKTPDEAHLWTIEQRSLAERTANSTEPVWLVDESSLKKRKAVFDHWEVSNLDLPSGLVDAGYVTYGEGEEDECCYHFYKFYQITFRRGRHVGIFWVERKNVQFSPTVGGLTGGVPVEVIHQLAIDTLTSRWYLLEP